MEEVNYYKYSDKVEIHRLFSSEIRAAIIYLMYLNPFHEFGLEEISQKLMVSKTAIQNQMYMLTNYGITTRRKDGHFYRFKIDKDRLFELVNELKVDRE